MVLICSRCGKHLRAHHLQDKNRRSLVIPGVCKGYKMKRKKRVRETTITNYHEYGPKRKEKEEKKTSSNTKTKTAHHHRQLSLFF